MHQACILKRDRCTHELKLARKMAIAVKHHTVAVMKGDPHLGSNEHAVMFESNPGRKCHVESYSVPIDEYFKK